MDEEGKALILPFTMNDDMVEDGVEYQCRAVIVEETTHRGFDFPNGIVEVTEAILAEKPHQATVATPIALEAKYKEQQEKVLSWEPFLPETS